MNSENPPTPDSTAVRVALWRALHLEIDSPPHIFEDKIGLQIAAPEADWQKRPDMSAFTRPFRASIVARSRFIEDVLEIQSAKGVQQYVILGAGLDTFCQRRPEFASHLRVFEIDRPGSQCWKRQRLEYLGFGCPDFLSFVPVDFESGDSWWHKLTDAGFQPNKPSVVASAGVSPYLSRETVEAKLRQIATFATGSTLVMSFLLPLDLIEPEIRPGMEKAIAGAKASGTPFLSFFTPREMLDLAKSVDFKTVEHISAEKLSQLYFSGRTDGLRPPKNAEELLVATT